MEKCRVTCDLVGIQPSSVLYVCASRGFVGFSTQQRWVRVMCAQARSRGAKWFLKICFALPCMSSIDCNEQYSCFCLAEVVTDCSVRDRCNCKNYIVYWRTQSCSSAIRCVLSPVDDGAWRGNKTFPHFSGELRNRSSLAGCRRSSLAGCRRSSLAGCRRSSLAGCRRSSLAGCRRSSLAGCRRSSLAGCRRSSLAGCRRSSLAGCRRSSLAGCRRSSLAGCRRSSLAAVIKLRNFHRPDIMSCHFAFCPDMSGQYFICHFFSQIQKRHTKSNSVNHKLTAKCISVAALSLKADVCRFFEPTMKASLKFLVLRILSRNWMHTEHLRLSATSRSPLQRSFINQTDVLRLTSLSAIHLSQVEVLTLRVFFWGGKSVPSLFLFPLAIFTYTATEK